MLLKLYFKRQIFAKDALYKKNVMEIYGVIFISFRLSTFIESPCIHIIVYRSSI